jgi:hypothetical protein
VGVVAWLVVRHARSDAPTRSKRAVVGLAAVALLASFAWPVPAALVLLGVGVYLALVKLVRG